MHVDEIRALFGYTAWANARILDTAARVPAEEFTRAALGPCRLHDTLRHILQPHYAHRHRKDGRRSPKEVLGFVHGVWCDDIELDRLFRLHATRVFDGGGYLRYKRWRVYGECGLAGRKGSVWLFGEVLTVAFGDDTLAQYRVSYEPAERHIRALTDARLFETRHPSPQPFLWDLSGVEWHAVLRLRPYKKRRACVAPCVQEPLFALAPAAGMGRPKGHAL